MNNFDERKKKYCDWVNKACAFVDQVGPQLNMPAASMQSNISLVLGNDINIMFLGHDAHEDKPYFIFENSDYFRERCKTGNDCWGGRNKDWAIWKNLRNSFIKVFGESTLMDDMEHLVFTNAIFFTGDKINLVLEQIGTSVESKCMELTRELAFDILKPKLLVCFSVQDVFDKLIGSIKKEDSNVKLIVKKFKPYHIKHNCAITQYNGITILGIPHPSGAHGIFSSLPAIVRIIHDLSKGAKIENIISTKDLFLDPQEVNNFKIPGINKDNIAKQVIASIDLEPYEEKSNRYKLNDKYGITITRTQKGYIALRNTDFNKNKLNIPEKDLIKMREELKERGYDINCKVWIGTKLFSKFGHTDSEIIENILKEIDILKGIVNL